MRSMASIMNRVMTVPWAMLRTLPRAVKVMRLELSPIRPYVGGCSGELGAL